MKLDWSGKATAKGDGHLNSQRFADDIILFSESANEPQQLINDMNTERLKVGLKMNRKMTKVMFNSRVQVEQIHARGDSLEVVDECIHLGQLTQKKHPRERKSSDASVSTGAPSEDRGTLRGSFPYV